MQEKTTTGKQINSEMADSEMVKQALADANSFGLIIDRYEKQLSRYIRRLLCCADQEVEDILQETFIAVYTNLNEYNGKYKFSSWIYRIAHNKAVNVLRKHKFEKVIVNKENEDGESDSFVDRIASDIDLEKELISEKQADWVKKALNNLDQKYKDVLVLKYYEDKDYDEIADILKISSGTVGSLITRGRNKLKELLQSEKY